MKVKAARTLDDVPEGAGITTAELDVRGRVSGPDEEGFRQAGQNAPRIRPVSNAPHGNAQISPNTAHAED